MVSVGFPQKSTFGTITAAQVNTNIVNAPTGYVSMRTAGAERLMVAGDRIRCQRNLQLMTGYDLIDVGDRVMLGLDDLGNIDDLAPITDALGVRTPLVDNPDGHLLLQRLGVTKATIAADVFTLSGDLKLGVNRELQDSAGNLIIASDNAGHIDQLARVDIPIKTPATSHYITSSIGVLVTPAQSGTIDEIKGKWSTDVDDLLYIFLGPLMGRIQLNAAVHIDSIKVAYKTEHNDAYVDYARCYRNSLIGVSTVMVGERDANDGNGNTDQDVFTIPINAAMVANFDYYIELKAEATAGIVAVYGIEVTYHTT